MRRRALLGAAVFGLAPMLRFVASEYAIAATFRPASSNSRRAFRWGVASADPQPDALMVWTKLVPQRPESDEALIVQLARDANFATILFERKLRACARSDHSVRVLIAGLQPDTTYHYRFIASDGAVSRTGRTWTAPSPETARPVLIALASCQSYPASQYGAYRNLIDRERRTGERPDFVLHLGDYVYGSEKQLPLDPVTGLSGPDTGVASVPASKGRAAQGRPLDPAAGLYDYDAALAATRALYDKYHLDRDLQDARALYPFVTIWDDHEFGNDVWQSFSGAGSNPVGRMAASQVWSEWVPQILSDSRSVPQVPNEARDFRRSPVRGERLSQFDDNFLARSAANLAAIEAMTSYRTIRWGKLVELIITDSRSYRAPGADPAVPLGTQPKEGRGGDAGAFPLVDAATLSVLAEGRFANGGSPPATITVNGKTMPNPRRDAPRVSMLGVRQKSWFKRVLAESDARWKVWANSNPITGFKWDLGKIRPELGHGFSWLDSWDGFPNERKELLRYIRDNRIANVVSLAGDRHAQFAACVADDYASDTPDYVIPEFTGTGISAFARAVNIGARFRRLGIGDYASARLRGAGAPVCTLDATLTLGVEATAALLAGADATTVGQLAKRSPNPQLRHADMDSHGYLLARFSQDAVQVEFVTMPGEPWDVAARPDGPAALRRTTFETAAWDPAGTPVIRPVRQIGVPTLGQPK